MRKPAIWFFDSVTLSNFALVGHLEILADRYRARGFVTTQVVDELNRGVAVGYTALADCLNLVNRRVLRTVTLDTTERDTFQHLGNHLGAGEAGTIAAALHRRGIAVTDDLAARKTCADMGVPVTGTLGILLAVVRGRHLTLGTANVILRKMIAAGFHSPVTRLPIP